jgi:TRAP-type uncharacterized transport system fused permease subunit
VFVFSPSLLIVAQGFTLGDFALTFGGCVLGIVMLAAALSRFMLVEMARWEQLLCLLAALLLIAPGLWVTVAGLVAMTPVILRQLAMRKLARAPVAAGLDVGYR